MDDATKEVDAMVARIKQNKEADGRYMWACERDYFMMESAKDEVRDELEPKLAEKDKVIAEKDNVISELKAKIRELEKAANQRGK